MSTTLESGVMADSDIASIAELSMECIRLSSGNDRLIPVNLAIDKVNAVASELGCNIRPFRVLGYLEHGGSIKRVRHDYYIN